MNAAFSDNNINIKDINFLKVPDVLYPKDSFDYYLLSQKEYNYLSLMETEILKRLNIALVLKERKETKYFFRVFEYVKIMLEHLSLNENEKRSILYSSLTYDIGKIAISDEILFKPQRLNKHEYSIMKKHCHIGYSILANNLNVNSDILVTAAIVAKYHHERWDGAGYPEKLKGEQIPLSARIIAIADLFNALTSDRPYNKKLSIQEAINIIRQEEGKSLDPYLVQEFRENNLNEESIRKKYNSLFS